MGDDISGGNGFQEYLMVERVKSIVKGLEVKRMSQIELQYLEKV